MKYFAANWKLHKTPQESREFLEKFIPALLQSLDKNKVIFFPPATNLDAVGMVLKGSQIEFGSQNIYCEEKGAFTGETSAAVVKELGGKWVLLGHSERRKIFFESDELIANKIALAQKLDLFPMLCIGESLQEREAGKTLEVIQTQLQESLKKANKEKFLAVAYEPVWAIGTGKVASTEQVREAHAQVRAELQKMGFSQTVPILYGGSVKSDNAKALIEIPNVDGFLVGGASLEVASFLEICNS